MTTARRKIPDNALTDQSFWDAVSQRRLDCDRAGVGLASGVKAKLKPLFSDHSAAMVERLCARHLPHDPAWKMIEIGCAPGGILARFHTLLGYQPYGLEYAPAGVEESRRTFQRCGYAPDHVYQGDILAQEVRREHRERYDLVMSFGLIEHFDDPVDTIRCHVDLIRPGGYLVITIPKLVGFSLLTMWLLRREIVALHNRNIMARSRFESLFSDVAVEKVYCGHAGFLTAYGLFTRRERSLRGFFASGLERIQQLTNATQRLAFMGHNVTWPWSPTLVYIGRKTGSTRRPDPAHHHGHEEGY